MKRKRKRKPPFPTEAAITLLQHMPRHLAEIDDRELWIIAISAVIGAGMRARDRRLTDVDEACFALYELLREQLDKPRLKLIKGGKA